MKAKKIISMVISVSLRMIVYALILIYVLQFSEKAYSFGYKVFNSTAIEAEPGREVEVIVTDAMSSMDIAETMAEKGLSENKYLFLMQLKLTASEEVVIGNHMLNTSMTPYEMIDTLTKVEKTEEE